MILDMKIEKKLIKNVRIKPEQAELLREIVNEIWKKTDLWIKESDVVHFLIEEGLKRLEIENEELVISDRSHEK